jgi:hypothetical protein
LLAGRGLALTSLQLHLPWADIGSGIDLLPLFLSRAWLTLFADAATVLSGQGAQSRDSPTAGGMVASVGVEVRLHWEATYMPMNSLQLGYGRAFGDISSSQWYIRMGP